jgi:hypothetical protein
MQQEISPLTARDYRWYVMQGKWKSMDADRMLAILRKMRMLHWLNEEQKDRIDETIGLVKNKANAATYKRVLEAHGV